MPNDQVEQKLAALPARPGVYLMKDADGTIIYVGKAVSLKSRVRSYFQISSSHTPKVKAMVERIADIEILVTDTELEALILECNLIKRHKPHYNVLMKDDKHYPFIMLTMNEPFPRSVITRKVKNDGNRYFGPYTDSRAVYETLGVIKQLFQLRSCDPMPGPDASVRPCLEFHIKQCQAPCALKVSRDEYMKTVRQVERFLEGKQEGLMQDLERRMEAAAEKLEFERAARIRDQIQAVRKLIEQQKVVSSEAVDQDVIALVSDNIHACVQMFFIRGGKLIGQEHFFLEGASGESLTSATEQFVKQYYQETPYVPKEILLKYGIDESQIIESWLRQKRGTRVDVKVPVKGEKKQLVDMAVTNAQQALEEMHLRVEMDQAKNMEAMEKLQAALLLPVLPRRIECFDISNLQGHEAVGSMVVVEDGKSKKSDYRRFKIKTLQEVPDDYASMREVVRRRLRNAQAGHKNFLPLPDLLLVDGGKGQLNVAVEVLKELDMKIPAAGLAKQFEHLFIPDMDEPVILPRNSTALHLVQRLRDEAHRFALTYHRNLRSKKATASRLDEIPGISQIRKQNLLRYFGSVAQIKEAAPEEIAKVPGMNRKVAEKVHEFLNA
ncbi:MAG: excinuclease ABC subunit UvrC [Armatimonadetes bacterium]|nr:excinuclease ABC subunit UvrC [Armatimonadota bacterium]